jgi:hypothetical protein
MRVSASWRRLPWMLVSVQVTTDRPEGRTTAGTMRQVTRCLTRTMRTCWLMPSRASKQSSLRMKAGRGQTQLLALARAQLGRIDRLLRLVAGEPRARIVTHLIAMTIMMLTARMGAAAMTTYLPRLLMTTTVLTSMFQVGRPHAAVLSAEKEAGTAAAAVITAAAVATAAAATIVSTATTTTVAERMTAAVLLTQCGWFPMIVACIHMMTMPRLAQRRRLNGSLLTCTTQMMMAAVVGVDTLTWVGITSGLRASQQRRRHIG